MKVTNSVFESVKNPTKMPKLQHIFCQRCSTMLFNDKNLLQLTLLALQSNMKKGGWQLYIMAGFSLRRSYTYGDSKQNEFKSDYSLPLYSTPLPLRLRSRKIKPALKDIAC